MKYDELDDNGRRCDEEKTGIAGASLALSLKDECASEIKADIVVKEFGSVRIWGQIKDCHHRPVPKALLQLLRCDCGKLSGVAHTISDGQGFYQFDLCNQFPQGAYKILAGRPVPSAERVLDSSCTSCQCREPHREDAPSHDSLQHCKPPACSHCGKSALCKTCAYYDEATETCRLENEQ